MPTNSYKTREIYDRNGNLIDDAAKEAAFNLNKNKLESLDSEDEAKAKLIRYLTLSKNYVNTALNLGKPVENWTNQEILAKIKAARREVSLGRLSRLETVDRVNNFKNRMALSNRMREAIQDVINNGNESLVDASISAVSEDNKEIKGKVGQFNSVAVNWISYLSSLKKDNSPLYDEYKESLEPSFVYKSLIGENLDATPVMLNMLQIIEDTDMDEFAYANDNSFARDFAKKYEKLKAFAEGNNILEYLKGQNNGRFKSKREIMELGNSDSSKLTEAKCRLASELLVDYETRMRIIASPYYALFAGNDLERLSVSKVEKMKRGVRNNEALNAYLDSVIEYKNRKATTYKSINITKRVNSYFSEVETPPEPEVKLASDKTFSEIENLLRKMYEDTKRASAYKDVRKAIGKYFKETNPKEKNRLYVSAIAAASTYLEKRSKSSYEYRKERCEELIMLNVRYKGELNDEYQAAHAFEKDLVKQQEISQNNANELEAKAAEMRQKWAERRERERIAAEEAEKERIRHEAESKRIHDEVEKAAANASKNAPKWAAKLDDDIAKRENEIIAKELKNRNLKIKTEAMTQLIKNYDELANAGKTYKDSEKVRKSVLSYLDKYVFKDDKSLSEDLDRSDLYSIPTAVLINAIKDNSTRLDEADYAKFVKDDIIKRIWNNIPTYDEIRKPIADVLKKKSGEVTELDRLTVYEHALHILDFGTEIEEIDHDSFRDMTLESLGSLALRVVDLDEMRPDTNKNETYNSIPNDQQTKYINRAAIILSSFTGVDVETYKYLPIERIAEYTENVLAQVLDKENQAKTFDACLKEAMLIKNNIETLEEAIDTMDRNKIIDSIAKVTGKNQSDLEDIPSRDIVDLSRRMIDKVKYPDEMQKVCEDYKKVLIERGEDYYRKVFLDTDEKRRTTGLSPVEDITRKEHGYTYVKKALGMDKIPEAELNELDEENLYKLISNIGVIKYLHESVAILRPVKDGKVNVREVLSHLTDEEYESIGMNINEYDKAIDEINSLGIGNNLKEGIRKTLKPEIKVVKVPLFAEEFTGKDIDIDYAVYESNPLGKTKPVTFKEMQADIDKHKKTEVENKKEEYKVEKWDMIPERLLNLIGDLYAATAQKPADTSLAVQSLVKYSDAFAMYTNFKNKASEKDPFAELLNGLSEQERVLIEGAKPALDYLAEFCMNNLMQKNPKYKPDTYLMWKNVSSIFKETGKNIDFSKVSAPLDEAVKKGEEGIITIMNAATNDAFDVVGGMGITDIFDLDGKGNSGKETLIYAQNSLRYDSRHGQGKFLQTLMNDYYKDSSAEDKRFMLSFIIKDFKKNDKGTDRQKGGNYFASSLKGAGPLMQKMMQGVPEYLVVPELRDAINVVKSDLRSINKRDVDKVLNEIKTNSKKKITSIQIEKPLGAASVAETFLCKVSGPKIGTKEAVIKVLRPDAKERMERELPLLRKSSMFADMPDDEIAKYKKKFKNGIVPPHKPRTTEAGFLAQLSEIEKEFDLKNEAKNCETGMSKYGEKDQKVKTVQLLDVPTGENYLIMTKAEGKTLDRHIKETRDLAISSLKPFEVKEGAMHTAHKLTLDNIEKVNNTFSELREKLNDTLIYGDYVGKVAKVWTGEALYGSAWNPFVNYNFRHGDLHSGNIMVSDEGATILDFGNACSLHHEKVTEILKMMSSVVAKKPDYFVDAFSNLINKAVEEDKKSKHPVGYEEISPALREKYIKELDEIFKTGKNEDAGIKILLSLTTAQNLGIKLPVELQNFSQCQQRLENSMDEVRQAAFETRESLDKLERMPLDNSIKDSMDPLVVFQREMLKKDSNGKYEYSDSYELAEKLLKEVNPPEPTEFLDRMTPLMQENLEGKNIANKVKEYKIKYYKPFADLIECSFERKPVTVDTFPGITEEWRKIYSKAKEEYNRDKELTNNTKLKIALISGFFTGYAFTNGIFTEHESPDNIKNLSLKAFNPPFDDLAFEKLMTICEVDLGAISKHQKSIDNIIVPPDVSNEEMHKIQEDNSDAIDAVTASLLKNSSIISDFADKLRGCHKSDSFEKGMSRVFKKYHNFNDDFQKYKKARTDYEKLTTENSREEFVNTRQNMIKLENSLVKQYSDICAKVFGDKSAVVKDTLSSENVRETAYLPEYVDVIYDVMMDNKASTLKRLGKKYTFGLKNDSDDKDAQAENTAEAKEEKKEEKKVEKKEEKKVEKKAEKKEDKKGSKSKQKKESKGMGKK